MLKMSCEVFLFWWTWYVQQNPKISGEGPMVRRKKNRNALPVGMPYLQPPKCQILNCYKLICATPDCFYPAPNGYIFVIWQFAHFFCRSIACFSFMPIMSVLIDYWKIDRQIDFLGQLMDLNIWYKVFFLNFYCRVDLLWPVIERWQTVVWLRYSERVHCACITEEICRAYSCFRFVFIYPYMISNC